jgi:hypothetical protein
MPINKLYRVFVSSTFEDLKEEREEVIRALLGLDCFPAGMELFPASDETKWASITKTIDGCDYFVVILGGKYGSTDDLGVSYTEREYDYAIDRGIPVLGFIHDSPDSIPFVKTERHDQGRERLAKFRMKVEQRMCRKWRTPEGLGKEVLLSLGKALTDHPREGWVRGHDHDLISKADGTENIPMNPFYLQDAIRLDRHFKLETSMDRHTVFIITGESIVTELLDRHTCGILRREIDRRGKGDPFRRGIIVSVKTWRNSQAFTKSSPAISIGGPIPNEITREWQEEAKSRGIQPFSLSTGSGIYLDGAHPRAVLSGRFASDTRAAVETYISEPRGLKEFLTNAWSPMRILGNLRAKE